MTFWQEEPSAIWYYDKKLKCSICHKRSDQMIEYSIDDDNLTCCWLVNRSCAHEGFRFMLEAHPDDPFIFARVIEYKPSHHENERRYVGLSLRYQIMKRDGFKCVLCGATSEDSKLEIDHIQPVIEGGNSDIENLQTLCFECNRGKRDDYDG